MPRLPGIPGDRSQSGPDKFARHAIGRYAGMGISFALTIVAFGALGWWVDGKLGTLPLFLIVGVLAGFAGGLISMVKRVPPARGRRTDSRSAGADAPGGPDAHR